VTRIEGHADINVEIVDGVAKTLRWEVVEAPRLFETMLVGRNYDDVSHIASRICGICSIAHSLASIRATEAAFGIVPSEQTRQLRRLLFNAEILESHLLHAYFLVAPDFFGADSAFALASSHPEPVLRAARMKHLAYTLADRIAGRKTHPISCIVGGFAKLPDASLLEEAHREVSEALPDFDETVSLFASLSFPAFERETEFIALTAPDEYAFLADTVASSDTDPMPAVTFLERMEEFCVPHSTAKHARHLRPSYMVGALSRFNLNADRLHPKAREAATALGLNAPCHNPYLITAAQVVESVHAAEDALLAIEALLEAGIRPEIVEVTPRAGRGVGAVEAPRGLLLHDYTYDDEGRIVAADCIIPTAQNHASIQQDMDALLPQIIERSDDEIRKSLEMLVRAYDPCVSCSTHGLRVNVSVDGR
jgi:coenzyme F420-reducing hydrogenase alpha subunit